MATPEPIPPSLSIGSRALKRSFDILGSALGLAISSWLIALGYVAASIATGKSGFFRQTRVGRGGRPFEVIKLRTMVDVPGGGTSVTTSRDARVTRVGRVLRRFKLDELPQLINVLLGDMSFVGPRPDVPGFADRLTGDDRIILSVRPGITGPATLAFRHEERLLAEQSDPEMYNSEVIYPKKVRLNRAYVRDYRFRDDLGYLARTLIALFR